MTIRYELQLLAASLTVGICLMMVYDGLRLFRTLIPHGNFWTGIEDAVYWAGSSITTFLLLFGQNDGILRWYAIFGVLMGMLVYNLTVSRILLRLLKKVEKYLTIRKIKRQKIRQKQLEEESLSIQQEIEVQEQQIENIEKFVQKAHKYVHIEELTPYALRELVSAIYVDAPDKSSGKRVQHIHIKYDGLGYIPLDELEAKEKA